MKDEQKESDMNSNSKEIKVILYSLGIGFGIMAVVFALFGQPIIINLAFSIIFTSLATLISSDDEEGDTEE